MSPRSKKEHLESILLRYRSESPALFFKNNMKPVGNHWLKIKLIGDPKKHSNRDAIGSRVLITLPDKTQIWREIHGGSGYLSMNPKQIHAGLGRAESADITITWPNGDKQTIKNLKADKTYRIAQGSGKVSVPGGN